MGGPLHPPIALMPLTTAPISIHSATDVLPASGAPSPGVHRLGPLDWYGFPSVSIPHLLLYPSGVETNRLCDALARVLDYYPHLAGRIRPSPQHGPPEVNLCNAPGVRLYLASCADSLDFDPEKNFTDQLTPSGGKELLPSFDAIHMTLENLKNEPILAFQRTEFANGVVALGMRVHHIACDFGGSMQFLRNFAKLYRGETVDPPVIESYMVDRVFTPSERQQALEYSPPGFEVLKTTGQEEATEQKDQPAPPATQGRFFRISKAEIAAVKQACASSGQSYSTFVALSALVYKVVFQARRQVDSSHTATHNFTSMDVRRADRLNLGERYFPNAIYGLTFDLDPCMLEQGSLADIAAAVHRVVRGTTSEDVRRTLEWSAAQPNWLNIGPKYDWFKKGGMITTHWLYSKMYDGVHLDSPEKPLVSAAPFEGYNVLDGLAFFLSSRDGQSVDIKMSLAVDAWDVIDAQNGLVAAGLK